MIFDHYREDWQGDGVPIGGPAFPGWGKVDTIVIHYTAASSVTSDTAQFLRNLQNYAINEKGYSAYYNCTVDKDGHSWEIRGDTYRNAANKGNSGKHGHASLYPNPGTHNCNHHSFSILQLVDGQEPANPAMIAKTRYLVDQILQENPDATIVGHQELDFTGCPGGGVMFQVDTDVFYPETITGDITVERFTFKKERLLDTRTLGGPTHEDGQVIELDGPIGAKGLKINLTAVSSLEPGFVSAYAADTPVPDTSDLNFSPAVPAVANQVDVPLSADASFKVFISGATHLVVDQVGYWI